MIIISLHEYSINEYPCLLDTCQGALSRHFWDQTIQKYFFLTFTRAENIALKSSTKTSINFLQEQSMVHFWFFL